MGAKSRIPWTDSTWNPVRGCTRVSKGCENCYAERFAARFSKEGLPWHGFAKNTTAGPRWTNRIEVLSTDILFQPMRWTKPRMIFTCSMSDLFHEDVPKNFIAQVFAVMAATPRHTYQVLTKRHKRMKEMLTSYHFMESVHGWIKSYAQSSTIKEPIPLWGFPQNVWVGASGSVQSEADEAIRSISKINGASVRFLSLEPLLGQLENLDMSKIDWVIVGGESGPNARPMQECWAKDILRECKYRGIPCFFKQGSQANWKDFKVFESFPTDLQVREFPAARLIESCADSTKRRVHYNETEKL